MTVAQSVARITKWMREKGAGVLVDNLAAGASAEALDAYERQRAYRVPAELRELWLLHAGQRSEQDGFVGMMDLLGPVVGATEDEDVHMHLEFLREAPASWADTGATAEEIRSDAWIPLASRGYADLMVVSALTGRVFTLRKDVPPLSLVAPSVGAWLEAYAERVEAGAYTVEEGFGDCYLSRDDAIF